MFNISEIIYTGTREHLKSKVFANLIARATKQNPKIKQNPKTIRSLITTINKSFEQTSNGYKYTYVELIKS